MKYRPKPHQQPRWSIKGGSFRDIPNELTHWEKFLLAENIGEVDLGSNSKVHGFIKKNWDKFYIPTQVLKMYGMDGEI